MKNKTVGGVLFLLLALISAAAFASAPEVMTYQGRLKESGLPVTGTRQIDIVFCHQAVGGACLSSALGPQNVNVVNGLFTMQFTIPGLDLTAGPWYLEARVEASPLSPREYVTASPYAIYASSAMTLVPNPGSSAVTIAAGVLLTATGGAQYSLQTSSGINVLAGTVNVNGQVVSSEMDTVRLQALPGATPTLSASAGCGSPAPTLAFSPAGTDMAGTVSMTTAAGAGGLNSGCNVTLTFGKPYASAPKAVLITPVGALTMGLSAFIGASSNSAFTIQVSNAPPPAATFLWSYLVIE